VAGDDDKEGTAVTASKVRRRAGRVPRTAAAIVIALLGLNVLSGCSSHLTPGVAATINSDSISENQVDSIVKAACAYTAATAGANGAPAPVSLANLRATITGAVVQFAVIDRAARAMHLTVNQATIAQNGSQNTVPTGLNAADTAALKGFFYDIGKSTAETQVIGAHVTNPSVTDISQVHSDGSQQAAKYLASYVRTLDIRINPAYGVWTGSKVVGGSGSLSEPVSTLAKDNEIDATQSQANTSDLPSLLVC
jgi:hypothetical protein